MQGYDPRMAFDDEVSRYHVEDLRGDEAETVAFLAKLAEGGAALEFAIGTGRVALPLMQAGVRVDGIELSPDMLARLREKPGGDRVEVVEGNMARVSTGRTYRLVYLVYNTIGNVITQDDQVLCLHERRPPPRRGRRIRPGSPRAGRPLLARAPERRSREGGSRPRRGPGCLPLRPGDADPR